MDSQFAGTDTVLQLPNTSIFVQSEDKGKGLLSIEEGCVRWVSDDQSNHITLNYPSIMLHAVSRDTSSFPHECLYLLYNPPENEEEEEEEEDEEEDEGEEEDDHIEKMTEIRFIPTCSDDLENIYAAICECQTLYPDPELSDDSEEEIIERQENGGWDDDEDEDEGGVFYTSAEEGLPHLSAEGRAVLEHLENVFQLPAPEEFSRMINGDQNGVMEQFEDLSDEMDDV